MRAGGSVADQMWALRADLLRNLGNITNRWGGRLSIRRWRCLHCCCSAARAPPCPRLLNRVPNAVQTDSHLPLSCCLQRAARALPSHPVVAMRSTTASFQICSFLARSALHEHFPVIPEPIREYIEEVKAQLEEVTLSPGAVLFCSIALLHWFEWTAAGALWCPPAAAHRARGCGGGYQCAAYGPRSTTNSPLADLPLAGLPCQRISTSTD